LALSFGLSGNRRQQRGEQLSRSKVVEFRPVEAEIVIKAPSWIGFQTVRQKGSHLVMKHPDGRSTVIPVYPGRGTRAENADKERCEDEQERIS
jgi:predicted RNA binding protein YcfA (HicA-like mRNA interferase family)